MRWDAVLEAVGSVAASDATLVEVFTEDGIHLGGDTTPEEQELRYRLITDTEVEVWAPCVVQFDLWCTSMADLVRGERALRTLFGKEFPGVIGGVYMWSTYDDGAELGTVSGIGPDRLNLYGRATRFRFVPVRERQRAGRSI